jgi:hypothetical protein
MNEPQPACYTAESILRDGYLLAVRYDAPTEVQERLAAAHCAAVKGREEPHSSRPINSVSCGNEPLANSDTI